MGVYVSKSLDYSGKQQFLVGECGYPKHENTKNDCICFKVEYFRVFQACEADKELVTCLGF